MDATKTPSKVKSDETLFAILGELKERERAKLTTIASELNLANSTVYDHLATLRSMGYVTKKDGKYCLGLRFLDLGVAARDQRRLYHIGSERIDQLAEQTGEKVWLFSEEDGWVIGIYKSEGEQSIRTEATVGNYAPLLDRGSGLAILAYSPEERVREYLRGLENGELTSKTVDTPAELRERLEKIRDEGVAICHDEVSEGTASIAAPIRDNDGIGVGAISIGGPEKRLTRERLETELRDLVLGISNEIEVNYRHWKQVQV